MRKILFALLLLTATAAQSQVYNNEWIDFSKTYYKFKVGADGLYRLPQTALSGIGLGSTPAEQFQLWRNGKQVQIYTSVPTGALGSGGYIEFWGQGNDGKTDLGLYRDPLSQHSDKLSLITDTVSYFLTVNTNTAQNLRFTNSANNLAGNALPAEPYFMHTVGRYFKDKINPGFAAVVGEYVYSSTYDKGEFWSSNDIAGGATLTNTYPGFNVAGGGPAARFRIGAVGNALNPRQVRVKINGNEIMDSVMDLFNDHIFDVNSIPLSYLSNSANAISVDNNTFVGTDRMVLSFFELTYPREFKFGNEKNFSFELPATGTGYYLRITDFNYGAVAPVLYDISNGRRYVCDVSVSGTVQVVLPASAIPYNLVLVNQESANITGIGNFTQRNFVNYLSSANQADYIIISHSALYSSAGGNNYVDQYRAYRASIPGGAFNAKVYDIDQLTDQFGFGINKHPEGVRNFLRYARARFPQMPQYAFIIGRGVSYNEYRKYEANPLAPKLNLVPSFGYPASDMMLSADHNQTVPTIPIGRLSVVTGEEVKIYLDKIKQYEQAQQASDCTVQGVGWMKNIVHVTGASDSILGSILCDYMANYKTVIEDTLFGAKVTSFCKSSTSSVQQLSNLEIERLFQEGISMITYFGHSSATTLEFNLDNPQSYNNPGKYPVFMVNGCNAGNIFTFDPLRFTTNENLSEKYVLANQRGGIGFIASTHFGIVNYLNIYVSGMYNNISRRMYGQSMGNIMKQSIQDMFAVTSPDDYYARLHGEQTTLDGDPALRLNFHNKPDYVVEDPMVRIAPSFISVAESNFNVKAVFRNNGMAIKDSITIQVRRQYPDNSQEVIYRQRVKGIRFADSINIDVPIVPTRDKGLNKIIVTVDADNNVTEYCETNNTVSKDVFIFEDELRPVYPANYGIVNRAGIKLIASTANPFSSMKPYVMEIDTTELFNSPFKKVRNTNSIGGVIEFDPGFAFTDSTVYYWRVSPVPPSGNQADYRWNGFSFVYLPNSLTTGYNQSHYYQHLRSERDRIRLLGDRSWKYTDVFNNVFVRSGTWAKSTFQEAEMSVSINGDAYMRNACMFSTVVFNVFDPVTFKPWLNTTDPVSGLGQYNSWANDCFPGREFNFEFRYTDTLWRRRAMNFMDNVIPPGAYVVVRAFILDSAQFPTWPQAYVQDWKQDANFFGAGNTLYHRFKSVGFNDIDSFYRNRSWSLVYKKGDVTSFPPKWVFSLNTLDKTLLVVDCPTPDTLGYIKSPKFGPAKQWKDVKWRGNSIDITPGDMPKVEVIGITAAGAESVLYTLNDTQQDFNISAVSPVQYPYMRLRMANQDSVNLTPFQLRYWRILYDPIPEGAVAPNLFFRTKDTLEVGEKLDFGIAFKNISDAAFDSLKVKMFILNRNNVPIPIPLTKRKPLTTAAPNDTLNFSYLIDTRDLAGDNTLYIEFNPDNDQPEQFHFNNFIYRNFHVRPDKVNPLLDVTFDGVHILNRDIVSAKPHILVKLKDEARFLLLDDTTLASVKLRYPDGSLRSYRFNTDTVRFTPATSGGDNTATIDFMPDLTRQYDADGEDEYELIVKGKDKSNNNAGELEYKVSFRVITKPMISNLLNYPNPFTTSTAFVFTVTGSQVPQEFKIQILTVTGKIVREITRDELGDIHIGRNITDFKWDGTDQYGQRLANGIYLYRVVTSLNGQKMDKFRDRDAGENTDRFFNNGYGKMYLLR